MAIPAAVMAVVVASPCSSMLFVVFFGGGGRKNQGEIRKLLPCMCVCVCVCNLRTARAMATDRLVHPCQPSHKGRKRARVEQI